MAFLEPGIRDSKEIWEWDSGFGIRDCIYGRDAGFNVITKRDPGNRHFEAPRSGISDDGNDRNDRKFVLSILHHAYTCLL